MLFSYGDLTLEEIQSKELIKNVVHIMGIAISLVQVYRDEYSLKEGYCQKPTLQSKISVPIVD